MIKAVLFDIGDTLVVAAPPATAVAALVATPIGQPARDLAALRDAGIRLGAVTDTEVMGEADVRALLAPIGLDGLLEVVITSVDVGAAKPDPRGILRALERLGVEAADALFVGDGDVDAAAAAAAGVWFARVTDGAAAADAVRAWLTTTDGPFAAAAALVGPLDAAAELAALAHHDRLTKPRGALGRVEALGAHLAAIAGEDPPPIPTPAAVAVFAGDHGVVARGVTPWPQEVTAQMVANFVAGGAAINVLARQAGASVTVVDVGVATDLDVMGLTHAPGLQHRNVRRGTADLTAGPAMTRQEAEAALDVGATVAAELIAAGARVLVTGEMGIGNTTPSAALIAAITGGSPAEVTGRGTGIDDATLARKITAIEAALGRLGSDAAADPVDLLAEVGGLEIAALAGFIVGGASQRVPVIVDGVIALAALLVASELCPNAARYAIAGHRSTEPGATAALSHLGLEPLLDLGLRLGEGSGACLALPIVEAAARILNEMATFDSAGVSEKS
ncbi:MAG: nicotinate-nucleotide--dimethylbenzimidazole phosphoribosyltransferase [Acidimicrobiaceae bacterium]